MPVVNGLFSELDLRSGSTPTVAITTRVHATQASARQTIGWIVATLTAVAALLLVAVTRRPKPWAVTSGLARDAVTGARAADVVVALVLIAWWVLAPAFYDDGWTIARQRTFASSGGFSNYFDSLAANLPLGYWLEWVQHWLTESTESLLILRLPALLCLAGTWVLCRWILGRATLVAQGRDQLAVWAMTCGFLTGAMAWGMTLRPEPQVALLVTGAVACIVRLLERGTVSTLALAAVLTPLAYTVHIRRASCHLLRSVTPPCSFAGVEPIATALTILAAGAA